MQIGFISRVDFGSGGFRQGLLELAYQRFKDIGVETIILAGGLVSGSHLKTERPKKIEDREYFYQSKAEELAEIIPRVKTYVMVSLAYDGVIGREIILRLHGLRPDIRPYTKAAERFPIFRGQKSLAVLVPRKSSWRADYVSTPVDRLLKDELKRSTQARADLYAVGCFGVFMHRPAGESPVEYFALPGLSKPEEITATENQVGIVIADIGNDGVRVRNISFKDIVGEERMGIRPPDDLSDVEGKVFEKLRRRGPSTIGVLEDAFADYSGRIGRAMDALVARRRRGYPRIKKDEGSGRFDFDEDWVQRELKYEWHPQKLVKEDRIVALACLHAGSVFTDYQFIVNDLPRIILSEEAQILAVVGDLIQGLKHDLMLRGEVIAGANYTDQENIAGLLLADVLTKVFTQRYDGWKKRRGKNAAEIIEALLPNFVYILGNHDTWVVPLGITPLDRFRCTLSGRLKENISRILGDVKYHAELSQSIDRKIVFANETGNTTSLPSGLRLGLLHPHTNRATTTTLRLQQSMATVADCQVTLVGNFHTAASTAVWERGLGQRVGVQLGTVMYMTPFEFNKNKIVDFGVGILRIYSREGRIIETQTKFSGVSKRRAFSNQVLITDFLRRLGIA